MRRIAWKKIAGTRDWIAQVYDRLDEEFIWDAIQTKVPELLRELRAFESRDPS